MSDSEIKRVEIFTEINTGKQGQKKKNKFLTGGMCFGHSGRGSNTSLSARVRPPDVLEVHLTHYTLLVSTLVKTTVILEKHLLVTRKKCTLFLISVQLIFY